MFGAPGVWGARECSRCGLLWLHPRPVPDDIGLAYATYYTHGEGASGGQVFSRFFAGPLASLRSGLLRKWSEMRESAFRRHVGRATPSGRPEPWLAGLLARVPLFRDVVTLDFADLGASAGGRLLDVGCGNGDLMVRMRDLGWRVTGVEPDPGAARVARERNGLEVHVGQLEDARLPAGTFDAVVLSHVVEHVYDPVALLRECARVLAPGGTVMIITPNVRSLGHRLLGRSWRGLEPPRHLHIFDPETLASCAARAGLRPTRVRTSARLMSRIWYASRSIRRGERHGAADGTRVDYLMSYVMSAVEELGRIARPDLGEEIVMAATKADLLEA